VNADELELKAKEARRMADIAKHEPIPPDQLEMFGDKDESVAFYESQTVCFKMLVDCHTKYMVEIQKAWEVVRRLRIEALYWRQKYEQATEAK
jgi:hypothetical protein